MIKKLTNKEEEIMNLFWKHGAMFIRELLPYFNDPKPHYNTVATIVKIMEEKGFVARQPMGNTLLFYPLITEQEYRSSALDAVISQYYNNSYASVVSQFVEEEKMDLDELKALIAEIENRRK